MHTFELTQSIEDGRLSGNVSSFEFKIPLTLANNSNFLIYGVGQNANDSAAFAYEIVLEPLEIESWASPVEMLVLVLGLAITFGLILVSAGIFKLVSREKYFSRALSESKKIEPVGLRRSITGANINIMKLSE